MAETNDKLIVLVPVDFSPPSQRAMAWAFDYVQRAPAEIHLLHVVDRHWRLADVVDPRADKLRAEMSSITAAAEAELAKMAPSQTERESVGALQEHVALGKPAEEILHLANKLGADVIVMGTHGLSGVVERMFIGSVAQKVVRQAPCTVVCVKPKLEGEA